jgi:hypothetical protein
MKFDKAEQVEMVVWAMKLADFPRSLNRAKIQALFNGEPPYTDDECEANKIQTNYNDLSAPRIDHDARQQFDNAFIVPNNLFNVSLDYGPTFKRIEWGQKITKEINKRILLSPDYLDLRQAQFAGVVLQGVGPVNWPDKERWCPVELGIEDVLIPTSTYRSLRNLPLFAVYRSYTANQIMQLTQGPKVDPGWNMDVVKQCIAWVDKEASSLMGNSWPEVWSPEKMAERVKEDSGYYASDKVPTIDVFDFYFWSEEGKQSGWRRRMVLDAWGNPGAGGIVPSGDANASRTKFDFGKGKFLYDSKDRVYRSNIGEIMHFQYGDISAVAPFKYHSVRSLGFLLYSVCQIQNRLKCRFTDAVFESMLQYFRVSDPADLGRLDKIDLVHLGILPEGLNFVRPEERWKLDPNLVEGAMGMNRQTMADVSQTFSKVIDDESSQGETATLTMAKASSSAALVGTMLNRAYARQKFQYVEIGRRFCIANSKDPDVRKFRVECLKAGIPQEALNVDAWGIEPNRVIGQGNQQLAVAIANEIWGMRPVLDPASQKQADRLKIASVSNDYDLANRLVPDQPHVSDSTHDTELAFGTLMQGLPVTPKPGLHPAEVAEKMVELMAIKVHAISARDGMGTPDELNGLSLAGQYANAFIQMLAQDKQEQAMVKALADALGNLNNMLKGFAQRQQQAAEAAAQGNGNGNGHGPDPKALAQAENIRLQGEQKRQASSQSHAQRTAERQITFEQKIKQDTQRFELETQKQIAQLQIDLEKARQELALERERHAQDQVQEEPAAQP